MATTWRLLFKTVDTNNPSMAEFVLAATPGGPSLLTGGTATSQTNYNDAHGFPALAFDGNLSTFWSGVGNAPQWLQYSPTTAISPVELRLTVRNDGYTNGNPFTFDLQNDKDSPGSFVTVQSYTAAAWSGGQTQTFAVPAPVAALAPGNAMVSQSRLEVLGKGLPKVTVAQSQLEVLGKTSPAALVSQSFLEVLFRPSSNTPGPRPRRVFVAMT